ncbi:heat repeat-containing protein 5b [Stylonychia lemnae]|uniref:Heat repeat-containing protein 5b n=1 Tax=Stylonychia lemnae TaxID=5949 RepID=A0A077ZTI6_STYLE|nr:heat repeat-containing protein 5b [Stylonychia lemnae]|eukprot:CDW72650.1 heat repeat-containing protein 5b [Stylonychia lemnae]
MAYQTQIVQGVLGLCQYGCGASLMRGMLDLLKNLFLNGDFTKLQSEFFEQILPQIQNPKASSHVKMQIYQLSMIIISSGCYLSSKIFKALWPRCHTPPTKDLVDAYFKIAKNSQDRFTKECAFKGIKQIIKSNPSNLFQISGDLLKHLLKLVNSDKTTCLRVYVQSTLNYTSMHSCFDQILQVSIKGFEDSNPAVLEQFILTCYHLLNLRLQESQQQGDIKTTFRTYNQQQRDALSGPQKKKQSQNFYDVPRTLSDMISFLCAILVRIQITAANISSMDNLRYALSQVMGRLIENNRVHLEMVDTESVLNPLLLSLIGKNQQISQQDADTFKQREVSLWVFNQAVLQYDPQQKIQILKHCLQSLLQRQLILSKDTLEIFQGFCKNQKLSTMLNESQIITLLRMVTECLFRLSSQELKKAFASEKELIDPIMPYIKDQQSHAVRMYGVEVIKTIGFRCSHLIHEIVSIFLSLATITNADLTSLRQVPILHLQADRNLMKPDQQVLHDNLANLNAQASSLTCLITSINHSLGGVPLALINQTINVAKGMILGNWKVGEDEDEYFFSNDLQKVDLQENQRREAGWIIFEGLVSLGNQWMGTRLSLFFKLLNSVFTKDMCIVNPIQLKDQNYQEKILNEFRIKKAALSTIRQFLSKCFVLLNNQLLKLIGTFLVNAVSFFINQDKEKKDLIRLFQTVFPIEYAQVKCDIYECLLMIPSSLYQSKFVHLLHTVCEEIVSEDTQRENNYIKGIFKFQQISIEFLHFEDKVLRNKHSQPTRKFYSILNRDKLKILNAEEGVMIEPFVQITRYEKPLSDIKTQKFSIKDQIMKGSILLFGEIFSSHNLNLKNKQQLVKHFISHTLPLQTQSTKKGQDKNNNQSQEQKINKVLAVALATLQVAKINAKKSDLQDVEIHAQLKQILKNCEQYQNMTLLRIQSEATVFLQIPTILKEPQRQLDQFIKEQEIIFQQLSQTTAQDELIANLVRYLDYESLLQPFMPRIQEIFTKLSKENNNTVREYFLHYAYITVKRVGQDYQQFFANLFPTCFHQMQTDIKTDYLVLNSLGKMVECQLRQNMGPVNESRRAQIVVKEFIEVLQWSLIRIDFAFERGSIIERLSGRIEKILEKVVTLLKSNGLLNLNIKIKCIEILASLVYKGYINVIKHYFTTVKKEDFLSFLLDQINMTYEVSQQAYQETRLLKKIKSSIRSTMSSFEEFESVINIRQINNFQNQKVIQGSADKAVAKNLLYRNAVEVLFVIAFKIDTSFNFKESLEFTRRVVSYSHTSLSQMKKPGEKSEVIPEEAKSGNQLKLDYNINEKVRFFVSKVFKSYLKLYGTVDNADSKYDLKKHLGSLISLGFSIISDDSSILKRVGFSIIITIVKLFKFSIEKIGDDDDDPSNQMDVYQNNPLLLEQYEAQIFSIIRQNMNIAQSKLIDPFIVMKNFKLIYHFLTIPICRDPSIIGKIIQSLTESILQGIHIFNSSEMLFYEKILTELHFKRLILISKILIKCLQAEKFSRIELNIKKLSGAAMKNNPDELAKDQKMSKFLKQDKERILETLTPEIIKSFTNHLMAALQDGLMITTMPKSSIKSVKDFTFIYKNGSRSAYNHDTIENSIQYFMKALSLIKDYETTRKVSIFQSFNNDQSLILNSLFSFYLSKPFEAKPEKNESQNQKDSQPPEDDSKNEKQMIYNLVKVKQLTLSMLNKLFGDGKLLISKQEEIDQYVAILDNLQGYGIVDINDEIVKFYQNIVSNKQLSQLETNQKTPLENQILQKIITIHVGIQPELIGQKRQGQVDYTANEIKLIKSCMDTLLALLSNNLQNSELSKKEIKLKIVAYLLYRITLGYKDISHDSLLRFYSQIQIQVINMLLPHSKDELSQRIVEIFIVIFNQILSQEDKSYVQLQYQLLIQCQLLNLLKDQKYQSQLYSAFDQVYSNANNYPLIMLFNKIYLQFIQKDLINFRNLSKYLLSLSISLIYQVTKGDGQDQIEKTTYQLMSDLINFLMQVYTVQLDTQERSDVLSQYMLLIFTIIQNRSIEGTFRNAQAELIFKLFQIDGLAFRNYIQNPDTNMNERALIEKIIKQFAVMSAVGQVKPQTDNQGKPGIQQPPTASANAAESKGKIQLTMSFNKK